MDPDLMGRDAADVNSSQDHILLPPQAATEGMVGRHCPAWPAFSCPAMPSLIATIPSLLQPYADERVEREDHGKGDGEHLLANPNITPHETLGV